MITVYKETSWLKGQLLDPTGWKKLMWSVAEEGLRVQAWCRTCLLHSWFRARVLRWGPVSVTAQSHRRQWGQPSPEPPGLALPRPVPGAIGCAWAAAPLPDAAARCQARLLAASPRCLFPVPPVSPVQRSWEFIAAGDWYASSQTTVFFPCKWYEMFQKKG